MDLSIQQTQAVMVSMPTWNQLQCNCSLNTIPALPAPFGVKCENINNSKQQLFSPALTPPSLPSMSDYDSMNSFNSFTQYNVSPPTLGASCNYPLPSSTFSGLCVCIYNRREHLMLYCLHLGPFRSTRSSTNIHAAAELVVPPSYTQNAVSLDYCGYSCCPYQTVQGIVTCTSMYIHQIVTLYKQYLAYRFNPF